MKGNAHKIFGLLIFTVFYFFNLFPAIINNFLSNFFNIFVSLLLVLVFSGGRFNSKSLWNFGLSPDIDFHPKMKRDWLMHSGIIPTLFVIVFPHPLILIASFFYALHVAVDLLNTRSWEGNQYTYVAVFLTVVLYYILVYSL